MADLESQKAEVQRQQEASEEFAAQLTARSEAIAADTQSARDAAEVRRTTTWLGVLRNQ